MAPVSGVRLTVIVDRPVAVYSGMVPGLVAGQYRRDELEIDVWPLARRAGARTVVARATGVDAAERRILLDGRPPLAYDTASFDVGSTVSGLDLPGVREHALPTRPIVELVARGKSWLPRCAGAIGARDGGGRGRRRRRARLRATRTPRARGRRRGHITLLENGPAVLAGYPAAPRGGSRTMRAHTASRSAAARAWRRWRPTTCGSTRRAPRCDAVVWVAGAASLPLFTDSGLPTDARGFVRVRPTLQIAGHDELFAVGDCASLEGHPAWPRPASTRSARDPC